MVSKNNQQWKRQQEARSVHHYGLRKLSIGVASVLLSTMVYMGINVHAAHADTVVTPGEAGTAVPAEASNPNSSTTEMTSGATGLGADSVLAKPDSQLLVTLGE